MAGRGKARQGFIMIKVEIGEAVYPKVDSGKTVRWRWTCSLYGVEGLSHQPLLDACREIKRMDGPPHDTVGLFWRGRSNPSLTCSVEVGARWAVDEAGPWFRKWAPHPRAVDHA